MGSRKPKPVPAPKERVAKIKIQDVKKRIPSGRRDTQMDSRPKRLKTRESQNNKAIRDQD